MQFCSVECDVVPSTSAHSDPISCDLTSCDGNRKATAMSSHVTHEKEWTQVARNRVLRRNWITPRIGRTLRKSLTASSSGFSSLPPFSQL